MQIHLLSEIVRQACNAVERDFTGNSPQAKDALKVAIASELDLISASFSKAALASIKAEAKASDDALLTVFANETFGVTSKRGSPAKRFNKDMFISAISREYNVSLAELHKIAETCKKEAAAPISIDVQIHRA